VPAWAVIVLAGLGGVTLEGLGGTRRIDLLAFPLLGLIAWNLAVYLLALSRPWLRRRAGAARAELLASPWLLQVVLWLIGPERWWGRSGPADASRWVAESVRQFVHHWVAIAGPLVSARAERLLHLGALSFGVGAVLGMYLRGLAVEYRAGWESTFLTAPTVAALLHAVLGPAAWILYGLAPGLSPTPAELFSVEAIERLRGPAVSGEAAVWIHLWALTTVLVVVAPRLVLAWRASRRARACAADLRLPLDDAYFLRVLAATRGAGVLVEVIPYSFRPSPAGTERASRLLLDLYGSQAHLHAPEPTEYGEPPPPAAHGAQGPRRVVVMFSLAQSPELEVHGSSSTRSATSSERRPPAVSSWCCSMTRRTARASATRRRASPSASAPGSASARSAASRWCRCPAPRPAGTSWPAPVTPWPVAPARRAHEPGRPRPDAVAHLAHERRQDHPRPHAPAA
jgi:hypothetical protein